MRIRVFVAAISGLVAAAAWIPNCTYDNDSSTFGLYTWSKSSRFAGLVAATAWIPNCTYDKVNDSSKFGVYTWSKSSRFGMAASCLNSTSVPVVSAAWIPNCTYDYDPSKFEVHAWSSIASTDMAASCLNSTTCCNLTSWFLISSFRSSVNSSHSFVNSSSCSSCYIIHHSCALVIKYSNSSNIPTSLYLGAISP